MNTEDGLSEKQELEGDFEIIVNAVENWVSIKGITGEIDTDFDFDSILVDDFMKTPMMRESFESMGYERFQQIDFDVNYVAEVLKGGLHPVVVSLMHDEESESPKFYASFTQRGKTYFYNFFIDEIKYMNWTYNSLFKRNFNCEELSYFEKDSEGEYQEIYTRENEHLVQLEDDHIRIHGKDLTIEGHIKGRFHDEDEAHFVVDDYLISISKDLFDQTIVVSTAYDEEAGSFNKIYGFAVKAAWDEINVEDD